MSSPIKPQPPTCIVASYGGSGSTFLRNLLAQHLPGWRLFHSHAIPTTDTLGIPVFNQLTGGGEGPFSRSIPLQPDAKIVVIYRDPAAAYLSRCSFKHFLHIWSGTARLKAIMGDEVSPAVFQAQWKVHKEAGRDILDMAGFLAAWRRYAALGHHDIAFVRYEAFAEAWPQLAVFLGIEATDGEAAAGFRPVGRSVDPHTAAMFADLSADVAARPAFEAFRREGEGETPPPTRPAFDVTGSCFTVDGLTAGAADSIDRLAVAVNVITSVLGIPFLVTSYRNYHAPDIDFFDIFGLYDAFQKLEPENVENLDQVSLTMTDAIFYMLYDCSFFKPSTFYKIKADVYPNNYRVNYINRYYNIKRSFYDSLTFKPKEKIFPDDPAALKVVVHLRRGDISGDALFDGIDESTIPEKTRQGIHRRKLLTIERAVAELETLDPLPSRIDLVIASDGVARLKHRFARNEPVMRNIARLEADLTEGVAQSDHIEIRVVERLIGTDGESTMRTLSAMHDADAIVSSASAFPRLMARIGGAKLVIVRD
jgi:hypothetical protein